MTGSSNLTASALTNDYDSFNAMFAQIDRLAPNFDDDGSTKHKRTKASTKVSLATPSPLTPSPRSKEAKRKRPNNKAHISVGVKPAPGRGAGNSPLNGATNAVRTTKAAASFTTNSKYVGSRVCKSFDGVIHFGTVKKYLSSVNPRWAVHYDDDDTEDMNKKELERAIELYERKKSEDVENRSTAEDADDGWDFGEDAEIECDLSKMPHKPIGLPQVALEETIEFLWEKGLLPFQYNESRAEVVDDWNDYNVFDWREGSGGGTAVVSYKSHPKVKVQVKWRIMKGRRRRKVSEWLFIFIWRLFHAFPCCILESALFSKHKIIFSPHHSGTHNLDQLSQTTKEFLFVDWHVQKGNLSSASIRTLPFAWSRQKVYNNHAGIVQWFGGFV